ncbi:HAD-IA family hydrolase [Nitrospinae bacterium AH_259_B05_G02_I21]|nr:HAD-IA family hydrolase [Nitrospinae bacterium AH_259_B05_G02_I21]MDA2932329.1 HAD-IA family hydrolase [Nitrospinae bacterium AH-259-F20]
MIKAFIFDLDGTLVQTEILKAKSYGRAAVELAPDWFTEDEVIEAFKEVVGRPREEVAQRLMQRFGLEDAARARLDALQVSTPFQVFLQVRMGIYESMLADPQVLLDHLCPDNLALLQWARRNGYRTGLATMSHCPQVMRVLEILNIRSELDFIATRDDVEHGKPDPEIYTLVARALQVRPEECLIIEDSLTGVKAALAAGMGCIVVTTDFTRRSIHESGLVDKRWIVDHPPDLESVAKAFIKEKKTLRETIS